MPERFSHRRAVPPGESTGLSAHDDRRERQCTRADAEGEQVDAVRRELLGDSVVWRIRSYDAAKQVLRASRETTQAGFTAEAIPQGPFRHRPILISDGPTHDEQRRKVGRFFAPKVVERRYTDHMHECAERLLDAARRDGLVHLDHLALRYSVEVTRRAVGLEHSSVEGMSRRLEGFFRQPPYDITRAGLGRTRRQWMSAAWNALVPSARFWLADVRPAVRANRRNPGENVISHLIAEGYGMTDIVIECMTYGTAGMVTTREFIAMACWHLLEDDGLRERYEQSDRAGRMSILTELIRLEPVVGHLLRRVREPVTIIDHDREWMLEPGDLVDIVVRDTNADPDAFGAGALAACPHRERADGVDAAGMSFSDGGHACPGRALALTETEVLVSELLRRDARLVRAPDLGWENLVTGYTLRGMQLRLPS